MNEIFFGIVIGILLLIVWKLAKVERMVDDGMELIFLISETLENNEIFFLSREGPPQEGDNQKNRDTDWKKWDSEQE